jgi:hypothetical protein
VNPRTTLVFVYHLINGIRIQLLGGYAKTNNPVKAAIVKKCDNVYNEFSNAVFSNSDLPSNDKISELFNMVHEDDVWKQISQCRCAVVKLPVTKKQMVNIHIEYQDSKRCITVRKSRMIRISTLYSDLIDEGFNDDITINEYYNEAIFKNLENIIQAGSIDSCHKLTGAEANQLFKITSYLGINFTLA